MKQPAKRTSERAPRLKGRRARGPIRYAVVGLGYIAQVAVLPAFRHARKNSVLAALVSGDQKKLNTLREKYRVPHAVPYEQYGELLRSGEIDAAYICLPNDMHHDCVVETASAGVHILCEKPLALTERECDDMLAVTRRADVRLMTAYRLHFEVATLKAIELVRAGRIGRPRFFSSTFSMQVEDPENIRLQQERGGGPLYDLGIYCINAARSLFRDEPTEVMAMHANSTDHRFREVEEMTFAMLRFPGERIATFGCSFGAADTSAYHIVGTKGDIRVDPAYEYAEGLELRLTVDGKVSRRRYAKRDQFAPEILYFSNCVLHHRDPEPSGVEGLADVRVIEAIFRSAARGTVVEVRGDMDTAHPAPDQELRRPAVREPELVDARSPGE